MKIQSEKYLTPEMQATALAGHAIVQAEADILGDMTEKIQKRINISTCVRESGDTHVLGVLHVYTDAQMREIMAEVEWLHSKTGGCRKLIQLLNS